MYRNKAPLYLSFVIIIIFAFFFGWTSTMHGANILVGIFIGILTAILGTLLIIILW